MTGPEPTPSRGFVYVAWGEKFVEEARRSAAALKEHMQLPVTLITTQAIENSAPFDAVIEAAFTATYRDKIKMRLSPYDETIFLDTDIAVLGPLDELFHLLDRFDIAYQPSAPSDHYEISGVPMHAFYEPSAGILVWKRNKATSAFFDIWDAEYTKQESAFGNGAWDQRSLRAALWNSDVRLLPLGSDWQVMSFEAAVCMNRVRIVHGRGKDALSAIEQCNDIVGPRLYIPKIGFIRVWRMSEADYAKLAWSAMKMALQRSVRMLLHKTGLWKLPTDKRKM
jgi:hypothetical protein